MASSSSAPFVVVEHTSSEQCFTNLCYCCPDDTRQFAVSLRRGPPWPWPFTTIQKKKKLYLALFNGKNVFSIQYPPKSEVLLSYVFNSCINSDSKRQTEIWFCFISSSLFFFKILGKVASVYLN